MTTCGLVLAGGRSSRFGREKAVEPLAGQPLLAWAARPLRMGCEHFAVGAPLGSGAAAYGAEKGWRVLPDGPGPLADGALAGVLEGLRWAATLRAEWLATAPCDTPFLPDDLVGRLAAKAVPAGGAVARTSEGLQPLCALWPVQAALERLAAERSHPPIRRVLAELGAAEAAFEAAEDFANLNTPDAFAAAERRLRSRA